MAYVKIAVEVKGRDSELLSYLFRIARGLATLALYQNGPIALETFQAALNVYQAAFEGGKTGNRSEILKRNAARKAATEMLRKIISFLQSVATEDDIPSLVQAGFNACIPKIHRKSVVAPASS
ncbi:hypothetical protein KP004_06910 [Geomonas oryzisoli]|uniref:Uncharacterized protein n=1 Tax=Geomonas oryzisoli TaxID=2847992 RepID=A0ABX8JDZ3_9BACT|nr:hypothetical protein [Geomonas oryzisoli]QWV94902.1 hypothetical protein KP004_06910 [Geomonas oryzisoli]